MPAAGLAVRQKPCHLMLMSVASTSGPQSLDEVLWTFPAAALALSVGFWLLRRADHRDDIARAEAASDRTRLLAEAAERTDTAEQRARQLEQNYATLMTQHQQVIADLAAEQIRAAQLQVQVDYLSAELVTVKERLRRLENG